MMSSIVVSTLVLKPVELVWQTYNEPKHMENWNNASDDWFCPSALSDFKVGGLLNPPWLRKMAHLLSILKVSTM